MHKKEKNGYPKIELATDLVYKKLSNHNVILTIIAANNKFLPLAQVRPRKIQGIRQVCQQRKPIEFWALSKQIKRKGQKIYNKKVKHKFLNFNLTRLYGKIQQYIQQLASVDKLWYSPGRVTVTPCYNSTSCQYMRSP